MKCEWTHLSHLLAYDCKVIQCFWRSLYLHGNRLCCIKALFLPVCLLFHVCGAATICPFVSRWHHHYSLSLSCSATGDTSQIQTELLWHAACHFVLSFFVCWPESRASYIFSSVLKQMLCLVCKLDWDSNLCVSGEISFNNIWPLEICCHDDSLIASLSQQCLISRLLNEVSAGNRSSSDELFYDNDQSANWAAEFPEPGNITVYV